jgi:hypothetical protein
MGSACCFEEKIKSARQFTLDESIEGSRRSKRLPSNSSMPSLILFPADFNFIKSSKTSNEKSFSSKIVNWHHEAFFVF